MQGMLEALHEALTAARVRYVIIGGIAASIHGEARTTRDADVVVVLREAQVAPLLRKFRAFGFSFDLEKARRQLKSGAAVKLLFPNRLSVDLRIAEYGIDEAALETREAAHLFGLRLFVCAPEELVVYKLARFSPLDREDIRAILKTQGKRLDRQRVRSLARQLARETGDPRLLDHWDDVTHGNS